MNVNGPNSPVPGPNGANLLSKKELKKRNLADFWKSTTYLAPYRRFIAIAIVSAFFIGLATVGNLGSILPVMRVLITGDSISNWVNRSVADSRLEITLDASESTSTTSLFVMSVKPGGPGDQAGLHQGDTLAPRGTEADETRILADIADPSRHTIQLQRAPDQYVTANLGPVHWWFPYVHPIIQRMPQQPTPAIAVVLLFCLFISLIGNIFGYFQNYYSDYAAIMAINDIRRRLYDHVLHAPMRFFSSAGTSDVTSRLVGDCMGLQEGFKNLLGQSIQMPINSFMAFGLALWISWKLTLFIVLFGPVMFIIIKKFGTKMRRASRRAMQTNSSMLGQIVATLQGIRVVKGANAERFERRRYSRIMGALSEQQLRMSRLDAISAPVMELSTLVVVCLVIVWATYLVREKHEITVERFFAVMLCLATMGDSLRKLQKLYNSLQKSGAAATRIFQILNSDIERPRHMLGKANRPRITLPPLVDRIDFNSVSFAYPSSSALALSDVNISVRKGETVAIVGRNGSGKTTLLALLPRLFDPAAGNIAIDGIDIQDVTLKSLRDQVTVVTQDSVIFPLSIAENIAYGHPLAARLKENIPAIADLRKRIEAAAKQAFAHDFILEKPGGYDTELVGLGGALSGGQKQRLNIARAIFRSSPILIFDEATSQVDAESEHLIQQAVESLMHDRTMFVIAHRLNTIKSADRIIVMDRGTVVAVGQHEELLNTSEAYNNLYERQLFNKPEEAEPAAAIASVTPA